MSYDLKQARKFFETIYAGQNGVLELRTFDHPKASQICDFVPVSNGKFDATRVEKFLKTTAELKLAAYYGVALRTQASMKTRKGDANHCQTLSALFIDCDYKHLGEDESLKRIKEFPLEPTVIVQSGGGLHVYWVLSDPILLQLGDGLQQAKSILRRLASKVADVVDEFVSQPVAILRVPGSFNYKKEYPEPRPVTLEFESGHRYSLAEIEAVIPSEKQQPEKKFNIPEEIKSGDRHATLFAMLRSQKARGFSLLAALAACQAENEAKCKPPIDKEVLEKYLRRCWNQDDQPNFKGTGFKTNPKGDKIHNNDQDNIAAALEKLEVELSYDMFSQRPYIRYKDYYGVLQDNVRNKLWLEIDKEFHFRPSGEFFDIVLQVLANQNTFHPVRDYLGSLNWDKISRVNTWLIECAGAADTEYTRAVSGLVLLAAVRRIMQPGCKFDEMLVLESVTGLQKSSALRALCVNDEWFSDDLPLNVDSKQIIERTSGKWIIEAQELSGMSKANVEHVKAFLSRQVDGPVRLAYARLPVEVKRQGIVIGSTNDHYYLKDATGNRRFWPVRVGKFDLDWIRMNRDQLWAEAVERERAGESIRLSPSLYSAAELQQERRRALDPWEELLSEKYHHAFHRVSPDEIWDILGIPASHRDERGQARISVVMQRLGFKKMSVRTPPREGFPNGKVVKGWGKGEKSNPEQQKLPDNGDPDGA